MSGNLNSSKLSIVSTPIGNLSDLSSRAVQILQQADIILAENPRHSRLLLSNVDINFKNIKLISFSPRKETSQIPLILNYLQNGARIAMISDAGTPGISDPGSKIINSVIQSGYKSEVIPGPSAVIAALVGSGIVFNRFAFLGFLPKKGKERLRFLSNAYQANLAIIIFESPYRITKTLEELYKIFGELNVVVARELTKYFETFHRGKLGSKLHPPLVEKGEMVIIVEVINPTFSALSAINNKKII